MKNYIVEVDYYQNERVARNFSGLKAARRYAKSLLYDGIGGENVRLLNERGKPLKIPLTPITTFEKEICRQLTVLQGCGAFG